MGNISWKDLSVRQCQRDENLEVPDLNRKLHRVFPENLPHTKAFKVLLLDLSQLFSNNQNKLLYDVTGVPLGLMYVLSHLNQKFGNKVNGKLKKSRVDFNDYMQLKEILEEFEPDVIGMRTLTFYKDFFHSCAAFIRQLGITVPIVAGGPYATSDYKNLLKDPHIDLVVMGEGEITFSILVEKMMNNNNKLPQEMELKEIEGLAFAIKDETPVQSELESEFTTDLE